MSSNGITAQLVFDGGEVYVPDAMGVARNDQLLGTPAEQLSELAGRICYDSLGRGRPSFTTGETQGYHDHIKQVGHGSVQEHANFTIEINTPYDSSEAGAIALACCNRPGVVMLPRNDFSAVRITASLRAVDQWGKWSHSFCSFFQPSMCELLMVALSDIGHKLAPHIISPAPVRASTMLVAKLVPPENDHERWVSMYMTGSRGLSHELVRHGDFTAISQRSTRYVDESESDWVEHPLITRYLDDVHGEYTVIPHSEAKVLDAAKTAYRLTAHELEAYLIDRGIDKQTSRKQARGAARGYLGNALQTELIFSASVSQWKWMLNQRASQFADAEIRELFCGALGQLKLSRYAEQFADWSLKPSPDGIGQVAEQA